MFLDCHIVSVMGSPELMTVTAYKGDISAGSGYDVTVGDEYSIIRDTIAISQPEGFEGDVILIQFELPKLSTQLGPSLISCERSS